MVYTLMLDHETDSLGFHEGQIVEISGQVWRVALVGRRSVTLDQPWWLPIWAIFAAMRRIFRGE